MHKHHGRARSVHTLSGKAGISKHLPKNVKILFLSKRPSQKIFQAHLDVSGYFHSHKALRARKLFQPGERISSCDLLNIRSRWSRLLLFEESFNTILLISANSIFCPLTFLRGAGKYIFQRLPLSQTFLKSC